MEDSKKPPVLNKIFLSLTRFINNNKNKKIENNNNNKQ